MRRFSNTNVNLKSWSEIKGARLKWMKIKCVCLFLMIFTWNGGDLWGLWRACAKSEQGCVNCVHEVIVRACALCVPKWGKSVDECWVQIVVPTVRNEWVVVRVAKVRWGHIHGYDFKTFSERVQYNLNTFNPIFYKNIEHI